MFEIASLAELSLGLLTGLAFGFLLHRGRVTRYRTILGQFLWTDHTVLRVMLTAVVVGSVGIYAMHSYYGDGLLHVKGSVLLANVVGGLVFGVGMVVLGYCPGTGVAALGDGSRHAAFGLLGMLAGAAVYAQAYPWVSGTLMEVGNLGKVTLPGLTGLSPWVFVVALSGIAVAVFVALRRTQPGPEQGH